MSSNGSEWQRVSFAFGDALKFLREDQGLTPEEFALLFDMDYRHYLETETGEGEPTLHVILRFAEGLACKPEELVTATVARMPGIDLEARIAEAKTKAPPRARSVRRAEEKEPERRPKSRTGA